MSTEATPVHEAGMAADTTPAQTVLGKIAFGIAIAYSAFHIYTGATGSLPAMQQRSIHLLFAVVLVFLLRPAFGGGRPGTLFSVALAVVSALSLGYITWEADALDARAGEYTPLDMGVGLVVTLVVLEGTRRVIGWGLPAIAAIFLAYAYVGPYLPEGLAHTGYPITRIVSSTALFTEGIFGSSLGVSANFVFLFILLAAFVNRSGAGTLIMDGSFALLGSVRGGPAKMAVVASSLFGTISGSAVANTGAVGPFTIPLMKRVGFEARFAAAIESASGVGGQIMPPVLGAAAFIMADFLRIPYWQIAVAAIIPAALYYLALFLVVDTHAVDLGVKGLRRAELPSFRAVVKAGWMYSIPPLVLVYLLGFEGSSAAKAALYTAAAVVIVSQLDRVQRITPYKFAQALHAGAIGALEVALATACAGIIVGVFTLTGLGLKFSDLLIAMTQGNLVLLLLATMLASLLLGAGLPSVPTYLLLAIIVAPAIVKLGVSPLASHMFIFYYGALADITPPLAVSAYVAAGIAGSNPFLTSLTATRLAIAGFVVPFLFVRNEAILIRGAPAFEVAWAALMGLAAVCALAALVEGRYLRRLRISERFVLVAIAACIVVPGIGGKTIDALALAALIGLALWQRQWGLPEVPRVIHQPVADNTVIEGAERKTGAATPPASVRKQSE
jgi:TRAP transporter 4TM/12TM fusion protein